MLTSLVRCCLLFSLLNLPKKVRSFFSLLNPLPQLRLLPQMLWDLGGGGLLSSPSWWLVSCAVLCIILAGSHEGVETVCVSVQVALLKREGRGPGNQGEKYGNLPRSGRMESTPAGQSGLTSTHQSGLVPGAGVRTPSVPWKPLDSMSPRHGCRNSLSLFQVPLLTPPPCNSRPASSSPHFDLLYIKRDQRQPHRITWPTSKMSQ